MFSPSLASSSRLLPSTLSIRQLHGGQTRWPKGKPKPAKVQWTYSPHVPRPSLPSAGTSTPHPPNLWKDGIAPPPRSNSVPLEGTSLTFHHSPPSSAPSYAGGAVPPFLQWVGGGDVALTGEEKGPLVLGARECVGQAYKEWDDGLRDEMREMRSGGASLKEICQRFDIPPQIRHQVQIVAPLTHDQKKELQAFQEDVRGTWSPRKRLAYEVRQKRRTYW